MGIHEIGELDPNYVKVPSLGEGKISIESFDGSEVYKGLGAGFVQWGQLLLVKIDLAERVCDFRWPEEYKVSRFGEFLRGKAASILTSVYTVGGKCHRLLDLLWTRW